MKTPPGEKLDAGDLAEALDEAANVATGAALLAEMAENDPDLRIKMPSILRALCKQIAGRLTALARAVDAMSGR